MKLILVWQCIVMSVGIWATSPTEYNLGFNLYFKPPTNISDPPIRPPSDTMCTTISSQTIRVSWASPPLESRNDVISGYKVIYAPSELWYDEANEIVKEITSTDTLLTDLLKYRNYTMQVLATTTDENGTRSHAFHCQTEQDKPEAPTDVKALPMSSESILVAWRLPIHPNGIILHYTVYYNLEGSEELPKVHKVNSNQMQYKTSGLEKHKAYKFWVTATTIIGEGSDSISVTATINDQIPAQIATYDETFVINFKSDANLPCIAVGSPTPDLIWFNKGGEIKASERVILSLDGTLFIKSVRREDADQYKCTVANSIGNDTITHTLVVNAPPQPPVVTLIETKPDTLIVKLKPHENDVNPVNGLKLHYKPEFGEWDSYDVALDGQKYFIANLICGSRHLVFATSHNDFGTSESSDLLKVSTEGSKPVFPEKSRFIKISSHSITLNMGTWEDGGCPIKHFTVEHKRKDKLEWHLNSNHVMPNDNYVISDLEPATRYDLRVLALNSVGFTIAEYEIETVQAVTDSENLIVTEYNDS